MRYRGCVIAKAPHPTKLQPTRETYDVMRGGAVVKANFATAAAAQWYIDIMIRAGVFDEEPKQEMMKWD